jgi:hypothetical protein
VQSKLGYNSVMSNSTTVNVTRKYPNEIQLKVGHGPTAVRSY